jgi:predicted amidohydrolase
MHDFTLALVQHASPVGEKAANLDAALDYVRRAKRKGAELVCFPELNITGHAGHSAMVQEREPVPGGPSIQALSRTARDLGIYISAGIAEDEHGVPYNTQFVIGPEGFLGKQRKVHLSRDEYFQFRGGTELPVLDLPFVKMGIIICYDNHFPEIARCLALKGAELLFCPHAARFGKWPRSAAGRRKAVTQVKSQWKLVHACRAYDNGCYVAVCNTAGRSALGLKGVDANHAGGCAVFNPRGEVMAESRTRDIRDEMVLVRLEATAVRRRPLNIQQRRPEVFRVLTEPTR